MLLKIKHIMQDRTEQYTEGQIKKGILYLMGHSERTLVQALGEHSHWLLYSSNDFWNFPKKLFWEISLHFTILFKVWFSLNFILPYSVDRTMLYVQQQYRE